MEGVGLLLAFYVQLVGRYIYFPASCHLCRNATAAAVADDGAHLYRFFDFQHVPFRLFTCTDSLIFNMSLSLSAATATLLVVLVVTCSFEGWGAHGRDGGRANRDALVRFTSPTSNFKDCLHAVLLLLLLGFCLFVCFLVRSHKNCHE